VNGLAIVKRIVDGLVIARRIVDSLVVGGNMFNSSNLVNPNTYPGAVVFEIEGGHVRGYS
jgi:hypothetical protein